MSHFNNTSTTAPATHTGGSAPINSAQHQHSKELRDTAAGCRERARLDLLNAFAMSTQNGRQVFEKSAASWTKRADMLHRIETGIEARLTARAVQLPELTEAEIAEDLAFGRL
jgi:hypothetical protein